MTRIRLRVDARGVEVWAEGHAGYATRGPDIVCAGVSSLLFGTLTYLRDHTAGGGGGTGARVDFSEGAGYLWFRTRHIRGGHDQIALGILVAGLRLIEQAYPEYVSVMIRERKNKRVKTKQEEGHGRDHGGADRRRGRNDH